MKKLYIILVVFLICSCFSEKRRTETLFIQPTAYTGTTSPYIQEIDTRRNISDMIISPDDLSVEYLPFALWHADPAIRERRRASLNDQRASNERLRMFLETQDKETVFLSLGTLETGNFSDFTPLLEFRNLEHLRIPNGNISDISGIHILSELENFRILEITQAVNITDIGSLSALVNLTDLTVWVSKDGVDASALLPLFNLEKLIFLQAFSESIKDIAQLTGLKRLGLWTFCYTTDFSPLQNLVDLQTLAVSFRDADEEKLPEFDTKILEHMESLTSLNLHNFIISNVEPLLNLSNLSNIDFLYSEIDEKDLMILVHQTNAEIRIGRFHRMFDLWTHDSDGNRVFLQIP